MNKKIDLNRIPREYHDMSQFGWFDKTQFGGVDAINHNGYLWFYDMEWMSIQDILEYDYEAGEDNRLIPFARTGGGDLWAWLEISDTYKPVVFCPSDDSEGIFYAPSLKSAMFRHILDFCSQNNFCEECGDDWEMPLETAVGYLLYWKDVLTADISIECQLELDNLAKLQLKVIQFRDKPSKNDYMALITPHESDVIFSNLFSFEHLDETFQWIND